MWRNWLNRLDSPKSDAHPPRDIAMAVLLLECARADFEHDEAEFEAVRAALSDQFGLAEVELDRLIGDAQRESASSASLYGPVERLNDELSHESKVQLMEWLWRVACADGRIDPNEEHLLRKLADLLHLSHADYIRTRLAAQGES